MKAQLNSLADLRAAMAVNAILPPEEPLFLPDELLPPEPTEEALQYPQSNRVLSHKLKWKPQALDLTLSFDDLLDEALDAQTEAGAIKADRKRLAAGGGDLTPTQREALRAQILRWESENEWTPQQLVFVERLDSCTNCSTKAAHFLGLYELQQRRSPAREQRFVLWAPQAVVGDAAKLPRSLYTEERTVPVCPACAWGAGFALEYVGEVKP